MRVFTGWKPVLRALGGCDCTGWGWPQLTAAVWVLLAGSQCYGRWVNAIAPAGGGRSLQLRYGVLLAGSQCYGFLSHLSQSRYLGTVSNLYSLLSTLYSLLSAPKMRI
ncbi:MAG: hypothetical protein AAFP92_19785, partial [Bacteroidota bacterium]